MAKKTDTTEEQLEAIESTLSRTEQFIEDNGKTLGIIGIALIVIVGGIYAYKNLYKLPLEKEAASEMFVAERFFEKDSLNTALNGNAQFYGFLDIADMYSGTKSGELAHYYAALCYIKQGNFTEGIAQLDEFSTDDPLLGTVRLGLLGDAFSELKQPEEAFDYYNKAVKHSDNAFLKPVYLMKAAGVAQELGEYKKALNMYKTIQKDFKDSQEARDIEKYISRMEMLIATQA